MHSYSQPVLKKLVSSDTYYFRLVADVPNYQCEVSYAHLYLARLLQKLLTIIVHVKLALDNDLSVLLLKLIYLSKFKYFEVY